MHWNVEGSNVSTRAIQDFLPSTVPAKAKPEEEEESFCISQQTAELCGEYWY